MLGLTRSRPFELDFIQIYFMSSIIHVILLKREYIRKLYESASRSCQRLASIVARIPNTPKEFHATENASGGQTTILHVYNELDKTFLLIRTCMKHCQPLSYHRSSYCTTHSFFASSPCFLPSITSRPIFAFFASLPSFLPSIDSHTIFPLPCQGHSYFAPSMTFLKI